MLRSRRFKKYILKRVIKNRLFSILLHYNYISVYLKKLQNFDITHKYCFFLTLPERQQCFTIIKTDASKQINFTTGKLMSSLGKYSKYYKKSFTNIGNIVMFYKKLYKNFLTNIYLFKIKNFNKRQFTFFNKFLETIKPNIYFLLHKKTYVPRWNPKKRIKRTILRSLNKI